MISFKEKKVLKANMWLIGKPVWFDKYVSETKKELLFDVHSEKIEDSWLL